MNWIFLALVGAVFVCGCAHSKPHEYRGYTDEQIIERTPTPRPSVTPGPFDKPFDSSIHDTKPGSR